MIRAALAALLVASLPSRTATARAEAFVPAPCDLPGAATIASRLRCGTVTVPQDPARPAGPAYALAVVVIASEDRPAKPDPVLYISGGPGSPLTR